MSKLNIQVINIRISEVSLYLYVYPAEMKSEWLLLVFVETVTPTELVAMGGNLVTVGGDPTLATLFSLDLDLEFLFLLILGSLRSLPGSSSSAESS